MFQMDTVQTQRFWILTSMIAAVAMMRLISLPIPNFAPIAAMALFGGAYFKDKGFAFLVPLAALFVTDVMLEVAGLNGLYGGMAYTYLAFFLVGCIGLLLRNNITAGKIAMGAVGGSVLFFLITNFAAWLGNPFYPQNFIGLMESYTLGLAFYKNEFFGNLFLNTIMGDIFYSALLFGSFEFIKSRVPSLARVQ